MTYYWSIIIYQNISLKTVVSFDDIRSKQETMGRTPGGEGFLAW